MVMSGGIFACQSWGNAIGTWWVEARNVAKYILMCSIGPHHKELFAFNVNNATADKSTLA